MYTHISLCAFTGPYTIKPFSFIPKKKPISIKYDQFNFENFSSLDKKNLSLCTSPHRGIFLDSHASVNTYTRTRGNAISLNGKTFRRYRYTNNTYTKWVVESCFTFLSTPGQPNLRGERSELSNVTIKFTYGRRRRPNELCIRTPE